MKFLRLFPGDETLEDRSHLRTRCQSLRRQRIRRHPADDAVTHRPDHRLLSIWADARVVAVVSETADNLRTADVAIEHRHQLFARDIAVHVRAIGNAIFHRPLARTFVPVAAAPTRSSHAS